MRHAARGLNSNCPALFAGHDKGRLGGREVELPPEEVKEKAQQLAQLIRGASFVVVHTGAGLSTSAGECIFYPVGQFVLKIV